MKPKEKIHKLNLEPIEEDYKGEGEQVDDLTEIEKYLKIREDNLEEKKRRQRVKESKYKQF